MKGILVIIDGMADLPHKLLDNMTPLEAAETTNMDFLATRGEMGYMHTVKPGFIPESDEAILSIFNNDIDSASRGWLEAKGANIKITRGDLAFRANFGTVDKKGNIIDRRVGRTLTTEEAQDLARSLMNRIKLKNKFTFVSTVQHRAVLVFHGGFSENITGNDLTYVMGKHKEQTRCIPLDDSENTQYTADIVNEFLRKAHEILEKHPVNAKRKERGLLPANHLFIRGPGIENPKLKQYKKWISPSYMPLEIGFSKLSGMKTITFNYPKLKKLDAYENLWDALKKSCKFATKSLKKYHKKFDYAYIHIKETDLPGHDNKPLEKKAMIEHIDKTLFKFLRKFAPSKNINIAVTADHATPCKLKAHSADPVPILLFNNSNLKEKKFSEKEARLGKLKKIEGKELLKKVGFTR